MTVLSSPQTVNQGVDKAHVYDNPPTKEHPKGSRGNGQMAYQKRLRQELSLLGYFSFFVTGDTWMNSILETWGCPHGRTNQRPIVMFLKKVMVSYSHKGLGENNSWFQRQPGSCNHGKAIQVVVLNKTLGRHGMFNNPSTMGQKSIVFGWGGVAMRGMIEDLFFWFKSLIDL